MIDKETIRNLVTNAKEAPKKHFKCDCPLCGKQSHFYIKYANTSWKPGTDNTGIWDCKSCGESGNIYQLLFKLGKSDLIVQESINIKELSSLILHKDDSEDDEDLILNVPNKKLPVGFKRLKEDKYLQSRGLTKKDLSRYEIGSTKLLRKLKHYVLFAVREDGEVKGHVGRCTKKNCEDYGLKRYENSRSTFSALLYGYDEITENTKTVIVVEGIFNKIRIDKFLKLHEDEDIKCVASFGKKLSKTQVFKLLAKGVSDLILFYDNDAAEETKKIANLFSNKFDSILIAFLSGDEDAADCSEEELFEAFQNTENVVEFSLNKLNRYKIR